MSSHLSNLAAFALATTLLSGTAFAATQYELTGGANLTSNDLIGSVNYSGNPQIHDNGNVYIGPLNMSVTTLPGGPTIVQTVYCTDIFDLFQSGYNYTKSASTLGASLTTTFGAPTGGIKLTQINALLNNAVVGTNAQGAAVQAAIWEIENETGTSGYSMTTGLFQSSVGAADQTAFTTAVQTDLAGIASSGSSYTGTWHANANDSVWEYDPVAGQGLPANQSFGYLSLSGGGSDVPLPEPATLSVLGVSILGLVAARRKRASKPAI